ncbi:MAG: ribosome biogenesis GTPase YlqF [Lachnospiraceae bacterium]|nr:ribosome biogenesis GTPase YlqF [Lachnospiraceae bacterium]
MHFQWYPGHMTKAKRMMQENIKLIDIMVELLDARVPLSSRNPDIDQLANNKFRLVILNKADLADEEGNRKWEEYFKEKGLYVLRVNSQKGQGIKNVKGTIMEACKAKIERDRKRGIKNRPIRAMVAGIPNVGKSTFINSFAGKACAKTGNKPGVTKGKQWIKINKDVELLDTPGILWPKFEDQTVGLHLAMIGSIKDEIIQVEEITLHLLEYLKERYPDHLRKRYGFTGELKAPVDILTEIGEIRACKKQGGEVDYEKAAALVMEDFRSGKMGKITLEFPE